MGKKQSNFYRCERGAVHFLGMIVLVITAAEAMLVYGWMQEFHDLRSELATAQAQVEELEDRMSRMEMLNTRLLIKDAEKQRAIGQGITARLLQSGAIKRRELASRKDS